MARAAIAVAIALAAECAGCWVLPVLNSRPELYCTFVNFFRWLSRCRQFFLVGNLIGLGIELKKEKRKIYKYSILYVDVVNWQNAMKNGIRTCY